MISRLGPTEGQIPMSDNGITHFEQVPFHQRDRLSHSLYSKPPSSHRRCSSNGYFRPGRCILDEIRMGNEHSCEISIDSRNEMDVKTPRRGTADTAELNSLDTSADEQEKDTRSSGRRSEPACWGGWIANTAPLLFNGKPSLLILDVPSKYKNDGDAGAAVQLQNDDPTESTTEEETRSLEDEEAILKRLSKEGILLERGGRLEEALKLYTKCLDLNQVSLSKIGHAYYQVGALHWKRGAYEESIDCLNEAMCHYQDAVLDGDSSLSDDIVEVMLTMGKSFFSMGDRTLATLSLTEALRMLASNGVVDKRHTALQRAKGLHLLGKVNQEEGNFKSATKYFSKALLLQKDILGASHFEVANSLHSIGSLHESTGRFVDAQEYYLRALTIYQSQTEQGSSTVDISVTLTSIGWIRYLTGNYEGSLAVYQESLRHLRTSLGHTHRNVAAVLLQTGMVYAQQGGLPQALAVYREAYAIQRAVLGDDHEDVAFSLCHIGSTLQVLGQTGRALGCVQQALQIQRAVFGPQHLHVAGTLAHLGRLFWGVGDHKAAVSCYQETLVLFDANGVAAPDSRVFQVEEALRVLLPTVIGASS